MKLVVSVADYGMTEGITDGAIRSIRDGIVTDVGILTHNPSYERAAEEIKKYPHISVGLDVNIVSGVPVSDPSAVPELVDENGVFIKSVERKRLGLTEVAYDQVYLETENQVKKFIEVFGHKPVYLMGHSWRSYNYVKAGIAVGLKYGIPTNFGMKIEGCNIEGMEKACGIIRPESSYYNLTGENVSYTTGDKIDKEYFNTGTRQREIDVIGFITEDRGRLLKNQYSLLRMHIGYPDADLYRMSTFNDCRCIEVSAACAKEVREWVKNHHVELISYAQFFKERPYCEYERLNEEQRKFLLS